jgi:hypothetical protein
VALDANFRKLEDYAVQTAYRGWVLQLAVAKAPYAAAALGACHP